MWLLLGHRCGTEDLASATDILEKLGARSLLFGGR